MIARVDVDGDNFRGEPRGKFERLFGDAAPMLDGHDDNGPRGFVVESDGRGAARSQTDHVIVAAHQAEKENKQGNKDDGDPGAFGKFRDKDHDDRDAGNESSEAVDQSALYPMRSAIFPPVLHHAELRQSEGEKGTDGIERDQFVGDSAEKNEQDAS